MKKNRLTVVIAALAVSVLTGCPPEIGPDTTPPDAPVMTGTSPTSSLTLTWTWTAPDDAVKAFYRFNSSSAAWTEISNMATTSHSETVTVDGSYTLYLKFQDEAGNQSAIGSFAILVDSARAVPVISSNEAGATNDSPFGITITFDAAVQNFTIEDLGLVNAAASDFTATSSSVYTVNLTPAADGTVSVSIPENVLTDLVGNSNVASNLFSINYDSARPTAAISSSAGAATNLSPIPLTIAFSETVTGFIEGDVTVANATITKFQAGTEANSYAVELTPAAEGAVTATVAADTVNDSAGNGNDASVVLSVLYDITPPAAPAPTGLASTASYSFSWTWTVPTDAVKAFYQFNSTSGTWSEFSNVATTSHSETVNADRTYTLYLKFQDAAGNQSAVGSHATLVDSAKPVPSLSSSESVLTNDSPFVVTANFNEAVTDFAITDLSLVNATAANFIAVSTNAFTVGIVPAADGTVTVSIPGDSLADPVGNQNIASNLFSIVYDGTEPTATLTSTASAYTNVSPIPLTIAFSEAVANFVEGNITVSNTTITKFQAGTEANSYVVELTPVAEGAVTASLAANVVSDAAGNGNEASTVFSTVYDITPPAIKAKLTASNLIVIENADYALVSTNFTTEADATSLLNDVANKIVLTDPAGNASEVLNVYDGIGAADGLKYAVETLSAASNNIYIMSGTYNLTPLAATVNVTKAIVLYGDYSGTFISCDGEVNVLTVGDVKGRAVVKDLIIGSPSNTGLGIIANGFAVDGNVLEVSGLKTQKTSGFLLDIKTWNGTPGTNDPYVMIPNNTNGAVNFQAADTAGTGWRKGQQTASSPENQPMLSGNMTSD